MKGKTTKIIGGIIFIFLCIIGGGYAVIHALIQWDSDDAAEIIPKESVSIRASTDDTASITKDSTNDIPQNVAIEGRVTVTFLKDKGQPFDNGIVSLIRTSTGKSHGSIKTGNDGTSGVVVFDHIPAGNYQIIGARIGEEGVREIKKSIILDEGELISVTIQLALDTPVTITVTVRSASDAPLSNTSLTFSRTRGDEGLEEYQVQTNDQGIFSHDGIFPHNWHLLKDGTEIGTINVSPSGRDQTFNVKTNSN